MQTILGSGGTIATELAKALVHYTTDIRLVSVAPKFMIRIIGLFVPVMKEVVEMCYQYDRDYVFDSSKFEKRFDFVPTPYADGIREIVEKDYPPNK